jgi:hypothetical protein
VTRRAQAVVFAAVGVAALAFLGALHIAESTWAVGASETNALFDVVAAWLACAALFSAGAAVGRGARAPWNLLAAGLALIAFAETVHAYFSVVRDIAFPQLWFLNFVFLAGYAVIIAGSAAKARSLPFTVLPLLKPVLLILVGAIFAHLFYQAVRLVSSPAIPLAAKFLILIFPVTDFCMLVLAIYIYTSFGGGVAGRPWMVVALGVLFIALSDLLGGSSATSAAHRQVYHDLTLLTQFVGYCAIAWGGWYQRAILEDVKVGVKPTL